MTFSKLWKQTVRIGCGTCLKNFVRQKHHSCTTKAMELREIVQRLKQYAPLSLAETWDNVGLLVEPSSENHLVKTILLTNDLTEPVIDESIERKADMVISYHPPIFAPLKSLTRKSWKQRIIVKAIENRIAIYSPHTAFDSVNGGVNDWLAHGLGHGSVKPLVNTLSKDRGTQRVSFAVQKEAVVDMEFLVKKLNGIDGVFETDVHHQGSGISAINVNYHDNAILDIMEVISSESPELVEKINIFNLAKVPEIDTGAGRLCTLDEEIPAETIVERIKTYLKLKAVRFAHACPKTSAKEVKNVKTIALCAGSGGSVLKGVKADMYLTGEMSHHEILDAVSNGVHVVLCEHTNTERGFFVEKFQKALVEILDSKVKVLMSDVDADPINIV